MTHGADSGRATRPGRASRTLAVHVIAVSFVVLAGCIRSGPPAPVDDRTGAYTRSGRPPASSANASPANNRANNRAANNRAVGQAPSGAIASAPTASGPITSAPITSVPIESAPVQSAPVQSAPVASAPSAPSGPPPPAPYVAAPASSSGPADVTVQVAPGQTLYAIAREHNVPVRALIDLNDLNPPYALRAGQHLKVPMLPTHTVGEGETLTMLARGYGVGVRALAETNHLEPPYRIVPGTRLLIPRAIVDETVTAAALSSNPDHVLRLPSGYDAEVPQAMPSGPVAGRGAERAARGGAERGTERVVEPGAEREPQPAALAALPPPPRPPESARNLPSGRGFLWPVQGTVASPFGPKPGGTQNDGINIVAKRGTAVHAAEDGVVVYAGNELRGYGNLLLIRHNGGWMTAYAHNDELLVGRGAHVKRGQVISKVGGTGGVSSPQLHFELRQSGRPVDPVAVIGPLS